MHPFFTIGPLTLPAYGVCALVGAVLAFLVLQKLSKHSIFNEDNLLDAVIFSILFGILGAKLLYIIVHRPPMPQNWAEWVDLLTTGLVFYGALFGGIGGLYLTARKTKKSFVAYTDIILPCFAFAHGCGRIGCLLAGCCFGMECTGPFCVVMDGVSRLAVQPMETAFLFIWGTVLAYLYCKKELRRGTSTALYMLGYAVWRFIIEFFRADDRGRYGALYTSQWLSIVAVIIGVVLLYLGKKKNWPHDAPIVEEEAKPAPLTEPEEAPEKEAAPEPEQSGEKPETAEAEPAEPAEETAEPEKETADA